MFSILHFALIYISILFNATMYSHSEILISYNNSEGLLKFIYISLLYQKGGYLHTHSAVSQTNIFFKF